MPKLTQKQLVEQLRELKEIKPRAEWVILAKSQIFNEPALEQKVIKNPVRKVSIFGVVASSLLHRKLAYSFATLLFIFVGLVGFAQYTMPGDLLFPVKKITEQSEAALTGQTGVKQSMATLNNRINDLAKAAKEGKKDNIPAAINEINTNAVELAKNLRNEPIEDSATIKEIAVSLKVLADLQGEEDLTETPQVKDLYQAVVENQLADLEKSTLTEEQTEFLATAQELYEQGDYVGALEEILKIN